MIFKEVEVNNISVNQKKKKEITYQQKKTHNLLLSVLNTIFLFKDFQLK